MPQFDVVCIGAANLDTIVAVDTAVGLDERVLSDSIVLAGGGPAATAAVALARLGASVAFCGVIGADVAGDQVRRLLELEGVDTRYITVDPAIASVQSIAIAYRDTGTRSIVAGRAPSPSIDDIPVDAATWLHADQTGYHATEAAIARSGESRRFSVDAGNPISNLDLSRVTLYAPTLTRLLDRYPGASIEEALAAAIADGATTVVATDGANGAWAKTVGEDEFAVPGFTVDVLSSMGAGDVFHGSLLAGLVAGLGLEPAIRQANAVAALSCRGLDGRSAIPSLEEATAFLAANDQTGK